jgi:tyrosyl-tRNA synthetase
VTRNAVEVVTEDELKTLLERTEKPKAYIGFEPSGLMHIGQGIVQTSKIKDLVDAGFDFTVLLANWHAFVNDKLGSDMENIRACGRYAQDCFTAVGVDPSKVRYASGDELVDNKEYWEKVLRVSKNSSIARIKRAMTIMGRKEEDAELDSSKLIYPAMQVTDIFELDVDLALGGLDQRHAHMLARDVSPKLGMKKVVALHTPLLSGLQGGGRMDFELKMSKSKPQTCIFLHDNHEEIESKIGKAFCPPNQLEGNPIIETWQYILFDVFRDKELKVERDSKHGGDIPLKSFENLKEVYASGQLHPQDLKAATVRYLDEILSPVRKYFESHSENLEKVREIVKPNG